MEADYESELQCAIEAVRKASRLCRTIQQKLTPEALAKQDKSPVTVADFSSQAVIGRELENCFPEDPLIAEEDSTAIRQPEQAAFQQQIVHFLKEEGVSGDFKRICGWIDRGNSSRYSSRFWTLDPIDGTKGFLRGEQYAVSLALIVDGHPVVSALGCPNLTSSSTGERGQILYAVRGKGAFEESLDQSPKQPRRILVSDAADLASARICESVESGHSAHDLSAKLTERLGISGQPVRLDSQAKYAVVARGEAEIYLRLPTRGDYREKIWDHAGGVLIVMEAGGRVTDVGGKPLDWTRGIELTENRGVVVTHGPWHDKIISTLSELGVR